MNQRQHHGRGEAARFRRGRGPFGPGFGPHENPFGGNPFGGNPFDPEFVGPRGRRGGGRARRGDVRVAIIGLLAEQPSTGYGLIRSFADRTDGVWRVSPGSVYPTLQQLVDEGLVEQGEANDGGRCEYRLTDAGRDYATEHAEQIAAAWKVADESTLAGAREYREAAHKLLRAISQVGADGTAAQRAAAVEKLDELRKALYLLLAE